MHILNSFRFFHRPVRELQKSAPSISHEFSQPIRIRSCAFFDFLHFDQQKSNFRNQFQYKLVARHRKSEKHISREIDAIESRKNQLVDLTFFYRLLLFMK